MTLPSIFDESCESFAEGEGLLDTILVQKALECLPDWEMSEESNSIHRTFNFKNYYETMAFVNAAAWVAHTQDHHPDLTVTYNSCGVTFTTHSAGGLTKNDLICANALSDLLKAT